MTTSRYGWLAVMLLLVMVIAGCSGAGTETGSDATGSETGAVEEPVEEEGEPAEESSGEGEIQQAFLGNCEPQGPLRLWNWSEYMDPDIMAQFGELYGVEVTEDNFSSNEELITKLRAGNSGYDLVFPSDYAVELLAQEGLISELTRGNIPNLENVDPSLMGLYYDPENKYSVPFQWGVTGIGYNTNYFETPPTSWADLFEADRAGAHEGFFSMLDDERESIGAALKYLGYSVNDTDPAHVAEARDILLAQKQFSNFSGYNSDNFYDTLAGEEVYFAHAWSGGTALAASENDAIRFVVPEEGGVIWMDNMAIPSDAANSCTAELFINYLLTPEIAAQLTDFTYYNTPVPSSSELTDPTTQELLSLGFVPDDETMERLEWIERKGDTTIFSDTWTEVKSR